MCWGAGWVMPGDSWPGQVRSFVPARNHQFRKVRVRSARAPPSPLLPCGLYLENHILCPARWSRFATPDKE